MPQDGAPSSIDVLAAQVRGAIDSQRWLLNNAHNFQSQSWGEYLRAATILRRKLAYWMTVAARLDGSSE